ncbi:hypothetical protein ACFLW1_00625 [Chloroflexota bacterium]
MSSRPLRVMLACKALMEDGMGHLTRCRSLLEQVPPHVEPYLVIQGPRTELPEGDGTVTEQHIEADEELRTAVAQWRPDIIIFDQNRLAQNVFSPLRETTFTVCLSPLFQHISRVHQIYHRTACLPPGISPEGEIHAGLEYTILSGNCLPVSDERYRTVLAQSPFAVAVSMGGVDAPNKTLAVLRALGAYRAPLVVWAFLGAGYSHSYDALVAESYQHGEQEIILVKANRSFWRVLQNCHLAVLSGGVTSYDAVYAGMPALNLLHTGEHSFIVRELAERGACLSSEVYGGLSLERLPSLIGELDRDRERLWQVHARAQGLIDGLGGERIWERITEGHRRFRQDGGD